MIKGANGRFDVTWPIGGNGVVDPEQEAGQMGDFEAFWNAHYRYFLMTLMAIGATLDDAHDTVHDVAVKMLDNQTWRTLTTNPKAWVRQAVVHTYIDQQRGRRRAKNAAKKLSPPPGSYVDHRTNVWEDWQWVKQQLCELPPAQREVVELILAELTTAEIANLLGKTEATVRQNLAHARKRLRENLGNHYRSDLPPRREDNP